MKIANKKVWILALTVSLLMITVSFLNAQGNGKGTVKAEKSNSSPEQKKINQKDISQVKVASQYRYVTDGMNDRTMDDIVKLLKETRTEFIFQGWNRQNPCPEKSTPPQGYSYENLRNAISKIKMEIPDVIISGGFLAEFLHPNSWNELTGETFTTDQTWELATDPGKWGIPKSKVEFQTEMAIHFGWTEQGQPYNPKEQMNYYFPDITNPDVKELFLSWAKKQIDSGVDAIWIDGLYGQAELFWEITGDINHPAVKESFEASSDIIDEIHKYEFIAGKDVYVISWVRPLMFEAPFYNTPPDFDGVMITIGNQEIRGMKMDEKKWDSYKTKVKEIFNDVLIFARIDYGNVESPLAVFSQELTKEQANQFLRIADGFLQQKGIIFIYPIHGGNMGKIGQPGNILSYGKYDWYDALAPEFNTYQTIKELAQSKTTTGINENSETLPTTFNLEQNYPNPFNPTTTISFSLLQHKYVTLKVFDVVGREVATLVNGELSAGEHSVVFDATNLSSGIYFYRLTTPTLFQTKIMQVLK